MKKGRILFLVFMVLCSCAAVETRDVPNLRERVEAYYRAKMAHDYREVFKFENMSLDNRFNESSYMLNAAKSPTEILEAEVLSIDLNEGKDTALVKIRLKYKLQPVKGFEKFNAVQENTIEDKWVYKNGNWYHVIKGAIKEW